MAAEAEDGKDPSQQRYTLSEDPSGSADSSPPAGLALETLWLPVSNPTHSCSR